MTNQEILNQYIKNYKEKYSVPPYLTQEIISPYIRTTISCSRDKPISNGFFSLHDCENVNDVAIRSAISAFENLDLTLIPKK